MVFFRGRAALVLLLIGFLCGCSAVTPTPSSLSSPLFTPAEEDTERLARLTHELDVRAMQCLKASACEEVHFARALVSLFENQEAASASFRRVIDENASSTLSASSRLWLQLIEDKGTDANLSHGPHHTVLQLMAQLVRDWMSRELAELPTQKQASEVTTRQSTATDSSGIVRALQKQVRERDRRIAILQSQMEDLKLIDQDHEKRKRTIRLPGTLP